MKWAYSIKHKVKAAIALCAILLVIIGGNFLIHQKFSNMDNAMGSLFHDRLKPSVYIYEISQHLYEKRLLLTDANRQSNTDISIAIHKHNEVIAQLIQRYEQTYLTYEEKARWYSFKEHLKHHNRLEQTILGNGSVTTASDELQLAGQFNTTVNQLNALNSLQMRIGDDLQKGTHASVGNTMMLSTLEVSLLIVLGLFTLILLSTSDAVVFKNYNKNANLN